LVFLCRLALCAVADTGYVGLSLAVLLAQHNKVIAVDVMLEKVELINNKKSPIQDDYIEKYLEEKELNLTATLDAKAAYSDEDFVVVATPTNYDSRTQHFDTSAVEAVIKLVIEYPPTPSWLSSLTSQLDIHSLYVRSSAAKISSLARSFCVNPRLSTITCTRPVLSWAQI
jgi:predicted dinucleotide-binding enzyme